MSPYQMKEMKPLLLRIQKGEDAAFREFIEAYEKLVMHIVYRLVEGRENREDLCQEVFLKVYKHLPGFRFECKISTWVAKITYYTCLNFLQKKKALLFDDISKEGETIETWAGVQFDPEDQAAESDMRTRLLHEIERLPQRYRTILTLYHLEGMSYTEIGDVMDLPEGTVKSHLFRARRSLKENLLKYYEREEIWK